MIFVNTVISRLGCYIHGTIDLLFIRVDVVCVILSQGVELPRVVEYTVVPLLKVKELIQLAVEQICK
jgi:hypothetical protein